MRQRERRSRRAAPLRRAVTVGLLLTAVTASAAATAAADDGGKERDVRLVYCLDDSHRAGLASAAVRLGLLKPGATADGAVEPTGGPAAPMTLTAWAERRDDDFGRACDALMAAGSESPGSAPEDEDGWLASLLTQWAQLPLVVLGALLTLLVQFWDRSLGERRSFKKRLETSRQTFRSAARLYLAAYERDPKADHAELLAAREALTGAFAEVEGTGARGRAARRLADGLPLSQRLPENGEGVPLGSDGRKHEADRVRQLMDRQLPQASDLSRTFVYWWWRALRDRPTGSGV